MATRAERQAQLIEMRIALASQAFNPSGPVPHRDLFAGRESQLTDVLGAVGQAGQHAILFGERGVGKTSLASLTHEFWALMQSDYNICSVRSNCSSTDSYQSIWAEIVQLITDQYEKQGEELPSGSAWKELYADISAGEATTHKVRRFLDLTGKTFIIVIDEFDQIEDGYTVQEFSNTIKELSDFLIPATIILVGVADTVDDLIENYSSIERALRQVRMPAMSTNELVQIVERGYNVARLKAKPDVLERIGRMSQGLPHYAHRIGQESGFAALNREDINVTHDDVEAGVSRAIELTNETIRASYAKAITSPQTGNLYRQVILACAMARDDDLGFFAAADVRRPLSYITKRDYGIPQFVGHLKKFCTASKGEILQVEGEDWSRRYRFKTPLMRPYVVLKGIQDNFISQDDVMRFEYTENGRSVRPYQATLFGD
ncbi:MAG: AAA family ATPase [Chloroflexota bacterium]|nr:AAA family ATPase [Chloroflexota bacterium]